MKLMLGARAQAFVLLALVATSGALAGVVGQRALSERSSAQQPAPPAGAPSEGPWRWEPRPDVRYAERLAGTLELTAQQESAIDEIVAEEQARVRALTEEVQPRFRAIAEETRDRIESVLTPEQRQRLRTLREQRMRAVSDGVRDGRGGSPPRWMREGPGRDAPVRRPPTFEERDSILRERRLEWIRQRDSVLRELRDSIVRERRNMPPERMDSIIRERRERMRERFEAQRETLRATPPDTTTSPTTGPGLDG